MKRFLVRHISKIRNILQAGADLARRSTICLKIGGISL